MRSLRKGQLIYLQPYKSVLDEHTAELLHISNMEGTWSLDAFSFHSLWYLCKRTNKLL